MDYPKGHSQNPFTQADVDAVKPDRTGIRHYPSGIYAAGCRFGEWCNFSEQSNFGERCDFSEQSNFGVRCDFSEQSNFGEWCDFGARCRFGEWCNFGVRCDFGEWCSFGARCSFSEQSSFGARCSFSERCSFGEACRFGEVCRFENNSVPDNWRKPYFAVDRIGSDDRKTYFFSFGGVIHIRAGCFFGNETAFREKLEGDDDPVKTRHYLAALELARDILNS